MYCLKLRAPESPTRKQRENGAKKGKKLKTEHVVTFPLNTINSLSLVWGVCGCAGDLASLTHFKWLLSSIDEYILTHYVGQETSRRPHLASLPQDLASKILGHLGSLVWSVSANCSTAGGRRCSLVTRGSALPPNTAATRNCQQSIYEMPCWTVCLFVYVCVWKNEHARMTCMCGRRWS